jgi:hypothetical protein
MEVAIGQDQGRDEDDDDEGEKHEALVRLLPIEVRCRLVWSLTLLIRSWHECNNI